MRLMHERFGSSSNPSLNGQHPPSGDIDKPLNEPAADKIRDYRVDYNNRPSDPISFMSVVSSTTDCLQVRILILQDHCCLL